MRAIQSIRDNGGFIGIPQAETYDPLYDNLELGIAGGGAGLSNGSTSILDCSSRGRTITVNGGMSLSSAQSKFYELSPYFDGINDFLSVSDNTAMEFGSRDFGISMWFRPDVVNQNMALTAKGGTASFYDAVSLFITSAGNLVAYASSTGASYNLINGTVLAALTAGVWRHVALYRLGTNVYIAVDGVIVAAIAVSTTAFVDNAKAHTLGAAWDGSSPYKGYMQDVLYYFDAVPWGSTSFTPPARGYLNKARRFAPGVNIL